MNSERPLHSFYHPIQIDQGLGRVREESEYARHVKQMLLQVLFTNPGERANRPEFGCGIRRMVFSAGGPSAAGLAQITITQALSKWLSTVLEVDKVDVTSESEIMRVHIEYRLKTEPGTRYLNLEVFP